MHPDLLDAIEAADLPAPIFRTAVRLARLCAGGRVAILSYDEIALICGTKSDNTVRGHLAHLHSFGLIDYKRNAVVTVWWAGQSDDRRALDDQSDRTARDLIAQRSPEPPPVIAQRANRAVDDHGDPDDDDRRALDDQSDRTARDLIAGRANRALDDQPNTGFKANYRQGRQAGQPSLPKPGGSVRGEPPELPELPEQPDPSEQERSMALLTDYEVGLEPEFAQQLAAQFGFEEIRRQVFRLRRDLEAGVVRSPGVLTTRLRQGYAASVTDVDRQSGLWRRHTTIEETHEELRRKYAPDWAVP